MPDIHVMKTYGVLAPADEQAEEIIKQMKHGQVMRLKYSFPRNYKFHRKYFALLNIGFDNWSPKPVDATYGVPQKSFDRFRKDTIILAGFYDVVIRLDGSTRIEAKSISFASMDEDEFSDLYSKTIDVFLKYVYDKDMTKKELDQIVTQYLEFA